jgi:hypothetical protein
MRVNNRLITDECRCKRCQKDDEYEYKESGFAVPPQDGRAGSDIRASQESDQGARWGAYKPSARSQRSVTANEKRRAARAN